MRARLAETLPETGSDAVGVIDELVERCDPGLMSIAGPRFFGWVMGSSELPGVAAYARVLTRAWAWLLGVQALVLACVVVLRQPGGLLATFGVASPFALSGAVWSAWLHAGSWLLVPVALVLEYAVRRLRLRHIPHASLAHFLIGLARNWPAVLRGLVDETPPLR